MEKAKKKKAMRIEFQDPKTRLENEKRSKLLDPKSELYRELTNQRNLLEQHHKDGEIAPKRMDFHIELIASNEEPSDELLISRCQELQGCEIEIEHAIMKKAIVIRTPYVSGYGCTHITIAYFPNGIPKVI